MSLFDEYSVLRRDPSFWQARARGGWTRPQPRHLTRYSPMRVSRPISEYNFFCFGDYYSLIVTLQLYHYTISPKNRGIKGEFLKQGRIFQRLGVFASTPFSTSSCSSGSRHLRSSSLRSSSHGFSRPVPL
ncbi:MAG: hypothetical protein METHAR1v1_330006 [Methanothrix sp.]|nr:MAG: hypothetical protein METHAR1v1_330006 [Methanothrix sp.]